jgi:hypothetical protein
LQKLVGVWLYVALNVSSSDGVNANLFVAEELNGGLALGSFTPRPFQNHT